MLDLSAVVKSKEKNMNISTKYKPVNDLYKTFITGENSSLDLLDIELDIELEFSYYPGHSGTPAKRNRYGSIISYQQIGDPPEPAELELLDVQFDINELKDAIVSAVDSSDYRDLFYKDEDKFFKIYFQKYDTYIFNITCAFRNNKLEIIQSIDEIQVQILSMNSIFDIECELI